MCKNAKAGTSVILGYANKYRGDAADN